jgi:hypothetical protein
MLECGDSVEWRVVGRRERREVMWVDRWTEMDRWQRLWWPVVVGGGRWWWSVVVVRRGG